MSSLESVTSLYPTHPTHFLCFQLGDRWANELADKNTAGIIDVADGLMRVTLDACVPYFLLLHGSSSPLTYYLSIGFGTWFLYSKHTDVLTRTYHPQLLLIMTLGL